MGPSSSGDGKGWGKGWGKDEGEGWGKGQDKGCEPWDCWGKGQEEEDDKGPGKGHEDSKGIFGPAREGYAYIMGNKGQGGKVKFDGCVWYDYDDEYIKGTKGKRGKGGKGNFGGCVPYNDDDKDQKGKKGQGKIKKGQGHDDDDGGKGKGCLGPGQGGMDKGCLGPGDGDSNRQEGAWSDDSGTGVHATKNGGKSFVAQQYHRRRVQLFSLSVVFVAGHNAMFQ